jgi:hypothetical protein
VLSALASALLGAFAKLLVDLVESWRRDQALREAGARTVENAQQQGVIDAVKTKAAVADDLARLTPDQRRERLQRWARGN